MTNSEGSRRSWKEFVGAAGVVVSLAFVGLELRQNTAAVSATARNDLAAGSREWLIALAESPELSVALGRWLLAPDISPQDEAAALYMVRALLRNTENAFFQVRSGVIDEEALGSYGIRSGIFRAPRFAAFWEQEKGVYDPGFVRTLDAMLASYAGPSDSP
jgi:hypothetical protein